MNMVTDPARLRRTDPGNPDVCNVFSFHKVFSPPEEVAMVNVECRRAGIGCVDCKKRMAANLNAHLEPFRARRAELRPGSRPGVGCPARRRHPRPRHRRKDHGRSPRRDRAGVIE